MYGFLYGFMQDAQYKLVYHTSLLCIHILDTIHYIVGNLVSADDHACNTGRLMQWPDWNIHDDGGAVGVSDDACMVMVSSSLW